jgi:TetR/AcrR family transcriptional regulator, regulator of cefoperazone and chloramphenicol sensitivity
MREQARQTKVVAKFSLRLLNNIAQSQLPCSFERTKGAFVVQAKLLDVAIREFGAHGLEGASTRSIAAAAGTAMSSITYHYGGKEGLYLAAAEHIAGMMRDERLTPMLEAAATIEEADGAREAIKGILTQFADRLVDPRSNDWTLFIVREQTQPTEAFSRIYAGAMGQMFEGLVRLVCVATGQADALAARVTVLTLAGQVLILKAGRATCRKLLDGYGDDAVLVAAIKARLAANVDAILDQMIAEKRGQP